MVTLKPALEEGRLPGMPTPPVPTYLFAGDSLTEGVYGESYVEMLESAVGQGLVVNDSIPYDTAATTLARIGEPLRRYRPQWVILAVGSNDVWLPWLSGLSLGWGLWHLYRRLRWGRRINFLRRSKIPRSHTYLGCESSPQSS